MPSLRPADSQDGGAGLRADAGRGGGAGLRADARRNRARILTAAAEVFAERGASASTEEVARRAGVAIGTVFRHFPTKDDLLRAILKDLLGRLSAQVALLGAYGDPASALFEFFAGMVGETISRFASQETSEIGVKSWIGS